MPGLGISRGSGARCPAPPRLRPGLRPSYVHLPGLASDADLTISGPRAAPRRGVGRPSFLEPPPPQLPTLPRHASGRLRAYPRSSTPSRPARAWCRVPERSRRNHEENIPGQNRTHDAAAALFPSLAEESELVALAVRAVASLVVQPHSLNTCFIQRLQLLRLRHPIVVQIRPHPQRAECGIG